MITKIARALLLIIIVLVAAVYIPKFYWMKFEKSVKGGRIFYSPIKKDFLISTYNDTELKYYDSKGKFYDRDQFEALTPLLNFRQLLASGKMPDSLNGVKLNPEVIKNNSFTKRIHPSEVDLVQIPLNPLLESKSGRVKLEMPDDFFRINKRMEFIDCRTNKINEEKSAKFTKALTEAGFTFPAKIIAGNPTTRKSFDEGYFVLDSGNKLFHIKMIKGEPFCVNTQAPADLNIIYMSIAESTLREFYGMVITGDNSLYLISYDRYKFIKLPVPSYDYKKTALLVVGDLFYRTISVIDETSNKTVVTDRKYRVLDSTELKWEGKFDQAGGKYFNYLVPFAVTFTDNNSSFIRVDVKPNTASCFWLTGLLLIATILIMYRKKVPVSKAWFDYVIVICAGIYGFIAIMLIKRIE